jgi:hypothetical protein
LRFPYREKNVVHRRGLSDLVEVFRWLRRHNVEQIVKVMVIDDGDPSHAGAAIEEALRDFKVEVWDWKKLDLCSDVIAESSKCVKEVSLYSSGSKAVLMGWASEEGLRNRTKFPEVSGMDFISPVLADHALAGASESVYKGGQYTSPSRLNVGD